MYSGKWWKFEWITPGSFSVGVHIDLRRRRTGRTGKRYGPYIDLHLVVCIVSVGVNPVYSGEYDLLCGHSRGGEDSREA